MSVHPTEFDDGFGQPLTAADPGSVAAFCDAYDLMLHFTGDPLATLNAANKADDAFVLGPAFSLTYRILGGLDPRKQSADVERLHTRAPGATSREQGHAEAALALHAGEFLTAAHRWDAVTRDDPSDFVASRFVHDVCLHIGLDDLRLDSAQRAREVAPVATPAFGFANGMLGFAQEELGRYDEAERSCRAALAIDDRDLWARHGLAHVYESTDNTAAAMDLLLPSSATWTEQKLLSNHVWWHVALRQLHAGDGPAAVATADQQLVSTTAFGLCDVTSLLWRAELAGQDVGQRWDAVAGLWATNGQRHTCGFLDIHTAMAYARRPQHPGAEAFWQGVEQGYALGSDADANTYNDITMRSVVAPTASGLRAFAAGHMSQAAALLRQGLGDLQRVGGSVVQREIIDLTLAAAEGTHR